MPFAQRLSTRFPAFALALALVGASAVEAGPPYAGRPVSDVLRELRAAGLDLIFSTAVVGPDLRVVDEPGATDPRAILDEILAPLALVAEAGPRGAILIVPRESAPGRLAGHVVSSARGSPIAGATVTLVGHGTPGLTRPDGSFVIADIPPGRYTLTADATGFSRLELNGVQIAPGARTELAVELRAKPHFVTEVVVTPNRRAILQQGQPADRLVTREDSQLAPTIGNDVTRAIALLPGVAAADNSALFSVRGSVPRDVSIVLDGLELYDPYHLQGFHSPFSLIDTNVVDRINFFGGGFTAEFGDRHGGFVELATGVPEGSQHGELELGTVNSRFSFRGPTAEGRGSWLVSGRTWYPETLLNSTELGKGESVDPRFADLYGKVGLGVGGRHALSLHGLLSWDRLGFLEAGEDINESIDALTQNGNFWMRTASAWSSDLLSETILSGGRIDRRRNGTSSADGDELLVTDNREVSFFGLRNDTAWKISDAHLLRGGIDVRSLDAHYEYRNDIADDPGAPLTVLDPDGTSFAVYASWRARAASSLATEIGLRWDRQSYTDVDLLSPRFNLVWQPDGRSELRFAAGRVSQSQRIHELQLEDGETAFHASEVSDGVELTYQRRLPGDLNFRADAYHRSLSDLRPRYENLFEPIELFPETALDRVRIEPDEARLRGIELLLGSASSRPLFWWASYVLSSAEDRVDGTWVPRSWDQPQAFRLLLGYRRANRWFVSVTAGVHTGWPTTPVTAEIVDDPEDGEEVEFIPGERNSARFPHYARLDLKAQRTFPVSGGRISLTLDVINLTDRESPCCIDEFIPVRAPGGELVGAPLYDNWLGITPYFSVLWQF